MKGSIQEKMKIIKKHVTFNSNKSEEETNDNKIKNENDSSSKISDSYNYSSNNLEGSVT